MPSPNNINPADKAVIDQVTALFADISRDTDAFAQSTGLQCVAGCGKCCTNPDVETTVTEMMPLALHLWQEGKAQSMLEAIKVRNTPSACVLFVPDGHIPGNGRCGAYAYRPGICRLFGFAAKRGKNDQRQLVTCRSMKERFSTPCANAQEHLDQGHAAPSIGDHAMAVSRIDPSLNSQTIPINDAVRMAIEKLSWAFR